MGKQPWHRRGVTQNRAGGTALVLRKRKNRRCAFTAGRAYRRNENPCRPAATALVLREHLAAGVIHSSNLNYGYMCIISGGVHRYRPWDKCTLPGYFSLEPIHNLAEGRTAALSLYIKVASKCSHTTCMLRSTPSLLYTGRLALGTLRFAETLRCALPLIEIMNRLLGDSRSAPNRLKDSNCSLDETQWNPGRSALRTP